MDSSDPSQGLFLSVVIPAYNEESRILKTLEDVHTKLSGKLEYEVLVVDDGSIDKTVDVVEQFGLTHKNVRVIREEHRGKGSAVRAGMLASAGAYRIFMDADNSTSIDQFNRMRPYLDEGYGVVIGSRAHKDSVLSPKQPWYRQIAGKIGNMFVRALALPGFKDTQCGFKAFSAQAAKDIFSRCKLDGWAFDVEVLIIARKLGYRIKEIPINWKHNISSRIGASSYLVFLWEVLRIAYRSNLMVTNLSNRPSTPDIPR